VYGFFFFFFFFFFSLIAAARICIKVFFFCVCVVFRAPVILKSLITHEVEDAEEITTLFRANSVGSKAIDMYMKLVGHRYLYEIVHPTAEAVYSAKKNLEVCKCCLFNSLSFFCWILD